MFPLVGKSFKDTPMALVRPCTFWGKSHLWGRVSWFDIIWREDSSLAPDHARPPVPFFSGHHDDVSLLETQVPLFTALVGVHGHVLCTHACGVNDNYSPDFSKKYVYSRLYLPSPDSEDFVGEGEGRFPLGGLSDTPDSLDTRKKKHSLNCG